MAAPLCKVCGKPVPKLTQHVGFGARSAETFDSLKYVVEHPANLAEAIRLAGNGKVLGIKRDSWWSDGSAAPEGAVTGLRMWSGDYAWGGHFHAQSCAASFGLSMANQFPDYAMPEHRAAVAAQKERDQ